MIIAKCLNLQNDKVFELEFWNLKKYNDFKRKCNYSKKIRIISVIDNSKYYD